MDYKLTIKAEDTASKGSTRGRLEYDTQTGEAIAKGSLGRLLLSKKGKEVLNKASNETEKIQALANLLKLDNKWKFIFLVTGDRFEGDLSEERGKKLLGSLKEWFTEKKRFRSSIGIKL